MNKAAYPTDNEISLSNQSNCIEFSQNVCFETGCTDSLQNTCYEIRMITTNHRNDISVENDNDMGNFIDI